MAKAGIQFSLIPVVWLFQLLTFFCCISRGHWCFVFARVYGDCRNFFNTRDVWSQQSAPDTDQEAAQDCAGLSAAQVPMCYVHLDCLLTLA